MRATRRLRVVPLDLREANEIVRRWHRHHKPSRGHKFSIGVVLGPRVRGAAIVGRPVSKAYNHKEVCEVARLVTDGTRNACSILYAACARAAFAMGYLRIQTYILIDEPGTSLRAAGWQCHGIVKGRSWSRSTRTGRRRTDQPECDKQRWIKVAA